MVFDTRTSDMMKASLAQYFDIPCEKLVEFILKAADFAQKKSRLAFDTTRSLRVHDGKCLLRN